MTAVLAVVALLLAFGVLAGGRLRPALYAGQCAAIALAALWQAVSQPAPAAAVTALVLAGQAAWLWPSLHHPAAVPPAAPGVTVGGGVLLVILATATAPAGIAAALAIMLLGLLGAVVGTGPFGLLCLFNGAALALLWAPRLPSQAVLAAGLAGLGLLAAGARPIRLRR